MAEAMVATIGEALGVREDGEHVVVADFLRLLGVRWLHCPNGGKRDIVTARKLQKMGVSPGVPDFLITAPAPAFPRARGIAIELKAPGGRVSAAQREWLDGLEADGWRAFVAMGAGDAIERIKACGYVMGAK